MICLLVLYPASSAGFDRNEVLRLVQEKGLFDSGAAGAEAAATLLAPLPGEKLPAVISVLLPVEREKEDWERAIEKLRAEIDRLEREVEQAEEPRVFEVGRRLEEARRDLEDRLMRAKRAGRDAHRPAWRALVLGLVLADKGDGGWQLGQSLPLGRFDAASLGAAPVRVDFESRLRDFNGNGIDELALDAFVELFDENPHADTSRSHNLHHLIEFFPAGARIMFSLDGGVESAGRCEGPVDARPTARYWIRTRSEPPELTVARSRSCCAGPEEQAAEAPRAGVERYAWSDKHDRWQKYEGIEPEAYLVIASSERDREKLAKTARKLKRRGMRRRLRAGRGYPRILQGDDVPGLKAGFFVLAVGLCPDPAAAKQAARGLRHRLRGRRYRIHVRGIRKPNTPRLPLSCPVPR